ncbi:DUF4198 domain-containing protein [Sphingobacterium griseoflavum]|uniref:Nickel transport complex protein, NikM subunit, transmembrane n=1 Tax=Sphingobacterium griseoflavum TaxID=1474952 RepID=A0ABQ3HX04_9SPHI|nr:DUF4198 domain-containing protein [Sphingobacterium griseoflavum]GHE33020.1 hypothetical protein GCM10017764_15070 [Sphingobacterium griseoflavum]
MKSLPYLLLVFVAFLVGGQTAAAHAIWLESAPNAGKGQSHEIRVYYGEYATAELEKTTDWYSDLRSLKLFVIKPDQTQMELSLEDKDDHFIASFTPEEDGTYLVYTTHPTKDLGGKTRYEFTSQLAVQVGKSAGAAQSKLAYQLAVDTKVFKKGDKVAIRLTKEGQGLAGQDVLLMSESGWSKTYKTDAQGIATVDVLWAGKYVAEFGHSEEATGTWHGAPYSATWQGITTSFYVK